MRRDIIGVVIGVGFLGPLLLSGRVWASGAFSLGGSSYGTGTVDVCSSTSGAIHEPSCGPNGGGKSWRIYKVRKNIKKINKDADWKIETGEHGGASISSILKTCRKHKVPYILIHGLNGVVPSVGKKFYVAFSQAKVKGPTGKKCEYNRGCYYDPNEAGALSTDDEIQAGKWKNGTNVTYDLAEDLYDADDDLTADFDDVGAFCTWGTVDDIYVLTAYAKEYGGGYFENGNSIDDDYYFAGEEAEVDNSEKEYPGFTWYKWDINFNDGKTGKICPNNTNRECIKANMPAENTTVIAYYLRDKFEGKTSVSGSGSGTTGWVSSSTGKMIHLSNCEDGCTATFNHKMRRTQGAGASSYSIVKKTNVPSISSTTVKAKTTFDSTGEPTVRDSGTYTLKPGDYVCETMTFLPQTIPGSNTSYSQVCVIADTPAESIDAKVKDPKSASKYHDWQDEVYGKPTDIVEFKTSYNPSIQSVANTAVDKVVNKKTGAETSATVLKNYNSWNNGYNVTGTLPYSVQGKVGSTDVLQGTNEGEGTECRTSGNSHTCYGYKVKPGDVGKTLSQTAKTNDKIRKVPYSVTFDFIGGTSPTLVATVDSDTPLVSKKVEAHIPYNFINTTSVVGINDSEFLYAGEEAKFEIQIDVSKKVNNETNGEYATRVDNGKRRLGISVDGSDNYLWRDPINDTFNKDGDMDGISENRSNMIIPIPDVEAGSTVCIKSAVYPKDSGPDDNMNSSYYDANAFPDSWSVSEEKCFQVAKRPSIQVWGGNIYSGGSIETVLSKKVHLAGYNDDDYSANLDNKYPYTFGSWGELGVIATGSITGFASASTLGYASNPTGQLSGILPPITGVNPPSNQGIPSPGGYQGSESGMFCRLSILSIANHNCSSGSAGQVGATSAVNGIKNDQGKIKDLASALGLGDPEIVSGSMSIDGESKTYYKSDGSITINGGTVPMGKTILIYAKNNITIDGDIHYQDISYDNIVETPKLIVYAGGNVNIACKVNRIDAVLMGNIVNTCSDGNEDNISAQEYSNQLTIYGAVIANKLEAKRTYGAAAGVNSMVSAEIIDFDPTLYLWKGINDIDNNDIEDNKENRSSSVDVVYTKELAPRL